MILLGAAAIRHAGIQRMQDLARHALHAISLLSVFLGKRIQVGLMIFGGVPDTLTARRKSITKLEIFQSTTEGAR
jgi:hypothetical protein